MINVLKINCGLLPTYFWDQTAIAQESVYGFAARGTKHVWKQSTENMVDQQPKLTNLRHDFGKPTKVALPVCYFMISMIIKDTRMYQ